VAAYIGPDGEVDAVQLDADLVLSNGTAVARRGDWLIERAEDDWVLDREVFAAQFRQKFPRLVQTKEQFDASLR
jgi:hypothetical protein